MAPTKRKPKTTGRARPKAKAPMRRKAKAKAKPVTVERLVLHGLRAPAGSHRARIRKGGGPVRRPDRPIKLLGMGDVGRSFTVKGVTVSASARAKIEQAGGTIAS